MISKGLLAILLIIVFVGCFGGTYKFLEYYGADIEATSVSIAESEEPEVLAAETDEDVEPQVESLETDVSESKPTPTSEPTSTPTPTVVITATPTPTPTLTPTPIPLVEFTDEEVMGFIDRFAGQYALDPNVLRYVANCESGFNQHATNGPYVGLFQFGTSAWVTGRAKLGEDANLDLRLNAEESTQTAAYLLSQGREDLWPNCIP